jgi:ADP-ribose pyrophosphatase YjhB (NUDIX family)
LNEIIVRVNGVLIEDNSLLLVEQYVSDTRPWAHPGGRPEPGETLEQSIVREIKEETGLDVSVDELLYVTDRVMKNEHVIIISFLVHRAGGELGTGTGPEFDTGKIKSVRMVPFEELEACGFSSEYAGLVKSGFPDRGKYRGNILD